MTLLVLVALATLSYYQLDSQARILALEQLLAPPVPVLMYRSAHP